MVNLRQIDRQFRPSDRQPGINNEGRGSIEQFFRDVGSKFQNTGIPKAFSNTGDKFNRYQEASNKDRGFFSAPNQYDADMARFAGNSAVTAGEFTADALQIPFEAGGQLMGYDVGSGKGFGDIPFLMNTTAQIPFTNFNNPFYDNTFSETFYDDVPNAIDDFGRTTGRTDDIFSQVPFQEYLNTKGFNVENLDGQSLYDQLIVPNIPTFDEFKANSLFQQDQYGDMSDEDYNNLLLTQYEKSVNPAVNKLYDDLLSPYDEMRQQTYIDDISNKYKITPELASSLLFATDENNDGAPDMNLGIFNDLLNNFQDMSSLANEFGVPEDFTDKYTDYQTEEGEDFFTDPVMELAGFSLGKSLTGNLGAKTLLQNSPFARATIGQAYPGIAGLRLNAYPAIPNAFKQFSNKFRGTNYKPTYSRPYGMNPLARAGAQTYGAGLLTEPENTGVDYTDILNYGQ